MATTAPPPTRPRKQTLIQVASRFGPNWYAAVMGTAIVANGAHAMPGALGRALAPFAELIWTLAIAELVTLTAIRAVGRLNPARPRPLDDPKTAVFLGCPPMALLAVGYGALGAGQPLLTTGLAITLDAALWTLGTGYGLWAAGTIMFKLTTHYNVPRAHAAPTWLLPAVAPMVSAALGPALLPYLPTGQARQTLLLACVAMFGLSLIAVLLLLPALWSRLAHEGPLPLHLLPTTFLVLGPLGQSITAATQFATHDPAHFGNFALLYGVPVLGFALLWLAIAGAATIRGLRQGMPFAMTWWAYTFPVGTCVTGATGLYHHTGLFAFAAVSAALYLLLLAAWLVTAARTAASLPALLRD